MKTKRRTFWSFFTRIGAGFLAFWLAVMAVFTVLLSQQRAKLMLAEMESKSDKLMGEDTDFLLDPSSYDTTDETELRRRLSILLPILAMGLCILHELRHGSSR